MKQGMASQRSTQTGGAGRERFVPPAPAELAGRFPQLEIFELIGHGGMGAVYKARQPGLDRVVALKILAPDRVRDSAFAERFGREARALARLSHPHIVGIHDFGEAEGLYYFIMEYVDGASLREVMQAGRLSPNDALALVPQICGALQFAHETGVVHRDIKPENILLDRSGGVKIADFGLAKLLEPDRVDGVSLTGSGEVMGTPAYMAPEQIEHPLDVDHRADIYAVGVVFYEMLTGELPLGRFDPPSSKVRMDIRLDRVVLRALAKEPTRRYQLASDVTADLESLDTKNVAESESFTDTPTRTIMIKRPSFVTWLAAYSFLMAGVCVLSAVALVVVLLVGGVGFNEVFQKDAPAMVYFLAATAFAGCSVTLAIWHLIAGFGALRLRNWARFNLIILALIEMPAILLSLLTPVLLASAITTVLSITIVVLLFRPTVARIFELGRGQATLPSAEAEAIERVIRRGPFS
jgi:tRNA A-37 threonylcarbamoyl transferase component Bud32